MAKIADGMELTSLDEGSAWKMLGDAAKSSSRVKSNLEFCCLIENPKTDTQVTIYRDPRAHKVWVAFRGTEQTKWKDVVIDMMINPRALELASSPDAPLRGTIRVSDIKVKGLDSGSCFMRLKLGKKKAVQHNLVEGDELRFGAASKQDEQCIGEEGDYTEEASANIRNIRYKSMRFLFQSWENS